VLNGKWVPEQAGLVDQATLTELGVDARLGHRAVSLDAAARRLELDDGGVVDADAIVIATGASPRHPFADAGVKVLRTLEDSSALRDAVAGGVRLVALGAVIGAALGGLHARNGVELLTDTAVASVERSGGGVVVTTAGGATIQADVVAAGIGVVPEVAWLEGSGLTLDNGVVCDESLFAADGIVAAGDLARWPFRGQLTRIEHWQMAADMGEAVAVALVAGRGAAAPFVPVPYFWSDQYGEKIQMLGRPAPDDEVVVVDGSLDERFVALYRRGDALSAVAALTRARKLMSYRPLLAAGISFDEALAHAASG